MIIENLTFLLLNMVVYKIGNLIFSWILGCIEEPNDFSNGLYVLGRKIALGLVASAEKVKAINLPFPDRTAQWVASQAYENDSDSGFSLTEVVWVEEDLGNNCIEVRANTKPSKINSFNDTYCNPNGAAPVTTSTPLSCAVNPNIEMPLAMQKIQEMQTEIEKLKEQIAMMCKQNLEKSSMESSCSRSVPSPPPCLLPPPPPPPPPSICVTSPDMSTKQFMSIGDLIKQKASAGCLKSDLKPTSTNQTCDENRTPTMADVLKNLNSVKLKPVARSPGGTPLRQMPLPCNVNDQQSIIANALRKKFARSRAVSPNCSRKVLKTLSPTTPSQFGQHLLKKTGTQLD